MPVVIVQMAGSVNMQTWATAWFGVRTGATISSLYASHHVVHRQLGICSLIWVKMMRSKLQHLKNVQLLVLSNALIR
jgi:hypothetical protein